MSIDFTKFAEGIKTFVSVYMETFVNILISPSITFQGLLGMETQEKYTIVQKHKFDEKPVVFLGVSFCIGLLLASFLPISGVPAEITGQIVASTVVSNLFVWLLLGVFIHLIARLLGGKGGIFQTIGGLFYVVGVLHPLLILTIYILAIAIPNALGYSTTSLGGEVKPLSDFFGMGISVELFYFFASTLLTMIYLYFPISVVHKLSKLRVAILYALYLFSYFLLSALLDADILLELLMLILLSA